MNNWLHVGNIAFGDTMIKVQAYELMQSVQTHEENIHS